jgi:preprotein translocase subunit SecG
MMIFFLVLVVLASVILGLIVLVQNPKGGGLAGSIGGFGNQLMGVKQTTDVLEKGTWIFAGLIGLLCIVSSLFMKDAGGPNIIKNVNPNSAPVQQQPATQQQPAPAPAPAK